jgi:hypothetical protein
MLRIVVGNVPDGQEWGVRACTALYREVSRILGIPNYRVATLADGSHIIGVNAIGNPKRVYVTVYWPEGTDDALAEEVVEAIGRFLESNRLGGSCDVDFVETAVCFRDGAAVA